MKQAYRYLLLVLACWTVALLIAWVTLLVGTWAALVLLAAVVVVSTNLYDCQGRTQRRKRNARLSAQPSIPVPEQVRQIVESGIIDTCRVERVVEDWLKVAAMLHLDATKMRWDDVLAHYYEATESRNDLDDLYDDINFMCEKDVSWKANRRANAASELCLKCDYDLTNSAQGARCPECGHITFRTRTLGDVLSIASGQFGGIKPNARLGAWPPLTHTTPASPAYTPRTPDPAPCSPSASEESRTAHPGSRS